MKKVLFLINSMRVGGAEKLLSSVLQQIDYSKYDVSLMCFIKDGVYYEDIPRSVKILNPLNMGGRMDHIFRFLLCKVGLLDIYYKYSIRKCTIKYDTIISFLEGFPTRMHSYILDRSNNNLSFIHTDLERYRDSSSQFEKRMSQEMVYSKMDKLVFVSNNALTSFQRVYPNVQTEKIVLRNFIDVKNILNLSQEFGVPKKGFTIVTVGRLSPVKGIDIIPDIAQELIRRGYYFYFNIVGSGICENDIREKIKSHGVEEYVDMKGYQKNPYPYILSNI